MAQYIIPITFADSTGFKEGLSPTIVIRQRDDVNLSYVEKINTTMDDKGGGDYVYVFYGYDKSKLYNYKIDGGSDTLTNRYGYGNNELDYYSNKEDWGAIFRGYAMNLDTNITKSVIKGINKTLEENKQEKVDLSLVMNKLDDISNKEVIIDIPDNTELLMKIEDIENKIDFTSIIKEVKDSKNSIIKEINKIDNGSEIIIKSIQSTISETINESKQEIINNNNSIKKEIIDEIEDGVDNIMSREKVVVEIKNGELEEKSIEKDRDFKELLGEINEEKETLEKITKDEDFISLLGEGASEK